MLTATTIWVVDSKSSSKLWLLSDCYSFLFAVLYDGTMILFEGKRIWNAIRWQICKSIDLQISIYSTAFIIHFLYKYQITGIFSCLFFPLFQWLWRSQLQAFKSHFKFGKRLLKLLKITKFRKGDISSQIFIINSFLSLYNLQSTSRYAFCQFSLWLAGLHPLMLLGSMANIPA